MNTTPNNPADLPIGVLANLARQAKTESENPHFVELIKAKIAYENNTANPEYVLKRSTPCLPDYKKHQIRLEQNELFALRLQEIFDERGINTDWNPKESNKLNVIGNIQFCWLMLKPTIPASLQSEWCPKCTTNAARELYFKTNHPKVYDVKINDLEYMLNWVLDIVVLLGLHDTKHGYSYINLKNFKEAFESHYNKISTFRRGETHQNRIPYIKVAPFQSGIETCAFEDCSFFKEMEAHKTVYVETIKYLASAINK